MYEQQIVPNVQKKFADHSRIAWGYTYFVRRHDLIKIGHSGAPSVRIPKLGQPREVLAIIPHTIIDEPTAHQKFAHLRVKGEWFQAAPDLLEFIEWAKEREREMPKRQRIYNTEFDATRAALIAMRERLDADTPRGHACSNLILQIQNYRTAEGERKAELAKLIAEQMARLQQRKVEP